ncbi:hypothetical protein [Peterkaempfera bronchialis]|uniref:Uncharacterized protein n=1 Tax=Peterkaempfera bronchialis TaxID=2126346 RepID=A0A345T3J2_9ACTN|nr:hypothetical protein [Peterkaempfera bronchialis]AXI80547.1 hypothetical protein C7M71_027315 [Peterkaempfera bronchialis]
MPGQEHDRGADRDGRLRPALRAEAARHTPDREYILRRVEQAQLEDRYGPGPATPARQVLGRPVRISGLGAVLGSLLLVGGAAAWAVAALQEEDRPSIRISDGPLAPALPGGVSPTAPAPGSPAPSGAPSPDASTRRPAAPSGAADGSAEGAAGGSAVEGASAPATGTGVATGAGTATATTEGPATGAPPGGNSDGLLRDRFLAAGGSVDAHSTETWTQSNVTVDTRVPLRDLQVEVRIARTPDVSSTGSWTTAGPADIIAETDASDSEIVYRFRLREGVVLPPGRYVFAAQYNHAEGVRDATRDRWTASASGTGGSDGSASLHGDFF